MNHATVTAVHLLSTGQVGFSITGPAGFAVLVGVLGAVAVALALAVARPWRRGGPPFTDRLRIAAAVHRYDLWLDLRGVGRRRRRDLRGELRANLTDAASQVGAREAVRALGSVRRLATDVAESMRPQAGPRWSAGVVAAGWAFAVVLAGELLATLWWASGAEASGAPRVEGSLPLFPGSWAEFARDDRAMSLGLQPGWIVVAAVAVSYLVAARPWLLVTRRASSSSSAVA
jgi:hypothetical protein